MFVAGRAPQGVLSGGNDAPAYILLGSAVSQGKGLSYFGQATAIRPPLYPLMLGGLNIVFGSYSLLVMRIVQVIAAVVTSWICAQTAVQLWGENSKWATFGFAMFMPTLLFFTPQILTEIFAAFFASLFLYFLVHFDREEDWKSLVGMGVCAGLLMLLRFNAIFVPLVAAFAAFRVPGNWRIIKRTLIPVAISAAIISPWIVRNLVVFHGGVLYSSQTGTTALQGAVSPQGRTQSGESEIWRRAGWWISEIETDSPRRLQFPSEVELDRVARHEAIRAWKELGFRAIPLLAKKVSYFWFSTDQLLSTTSFPTGQRLLRAMGVLFYWGTLGVATVGWFRLRKTAPRIACLFALYCVALTMLHLFFTMNTRLRVPFIDPLLCILVGGQISAALSMNVPDVGRLKIVALTPD